MSLIHWHFKGKGPLFSRSALHVRGSCFKNLAFRCPQGTILIELRLSNDQNASMHVSTALLLTVIY